MNTNEKRSNFTGSLGFVLAAAGSAVGLGNIWRFPYLAAKDGGGLFLLVYLILALTFGFTLLTTEIAIGRKTGQSPLTAYRSLNPRFGWLGTVACLVPVMILPYYCALGGWVLKYLFTYLSGQGMAAVADGYFTDFITSQWTPILWFVLYLGATSFVVYKGVNSGIERLSRILMPILVILILGISIFSLTLTHTGDDGIMRTGLQGLRIYLIPDFTGLTFQKIITVVMDAMGQLFFSISVAMGIMVTYGSYVKKETNLVTAVNQIEIFDTIVAFLAGMMIVPAVYTFMGVEGMQGGPSLMFEALPRIFGAMGGVGHVLGFVFFLMVAFAALTSSVSVMEAIVSSVIDRFHLERRKATLLVTLYALVFGAIVCLGYNVFFFSITLPNGSAAQILDVMDYISNYLLMPVVAITTCIMVGYVIKPQAIIDEVSIGGVKFSRRALYLFTIKYAAPILLFFLLLQSLGLFSL